MSASINPDIVTDGLVLCLDAGNSRSYPGLGPELVTNSDLLVADDGNYDTIENTNSPICYTGAVSTAGKTYQISWKVLARRGTTSATLRMNLTGIPNSINFNTTPGILNTSTLTIPNSSSLNIVADNTGVDFDLDYVSIRELNTIWTDLSGNGNSGTLGNHIFTSDNKGSISFNGSSTTCLISASESLKLITAPLTIVAWAYQDTSSVRCIFAQYSNTTNYRLTKMLRIDGSTMYYYYGINNGSFSQLTKVGMELNKWNYYSVTVSGTPTAAYIQLGYNLDYTNLTFRNNLSTTPDLTTPVTIGSNGGYGEDWDGNISTVMFYNRALSQDDLLKNYLATKGRYGL